MSNLKLEKTFVSNIQPYHRLKYRTYIQSRLWSDFPLTNSKFRFGAAQPFRRRCAFNTRTSQKSLCTSTCALPSEAKDLPSLSAQGITRTLRFTLELASVDVLSQTLGDDMVEREAVRRLLRGTGPLSALTQSSLEWATEQASEEYHTRAKKEGGSLRSYLEYHLHDYLQPQLGENGGVPTPGGLMAQALLGTELDQAKVCNILNQVLQERLRARCKILRESQVCISWCGEYTNLSTCSMKFGSIEISLVLGLSDEDFVQQVGEILANH